MNRCKLMGVSRRNNCISMHVEGIQTHLEDLLQSLNTNLEFNIKCNTSIQEIKITVSGDQSTYNVKNYDMKEWQNLATCIHDLSKDQWKTFFNASVDSRQRLLEDMERSATKQKKKPPKTKRKSPKVRRKSCKTLTLPSVHLKHLLRL